MKSGWSDTHVGIECHAQKLVSRTAPPSAAVVVKCRDTWASACREGVQSGRPFCGVRQLPIRQETGSPKRFCAFIASRMGVDRKLVGKAWERHFPRAPGRPGHELVRPPPKGEPLPPKSAATVPGGSGRQDRRGAAAHRSRRRCRAFCRRLQLPLPAIRRRCADGHGIA